jgi:flagellar basal-body rod protein FlgF
MDNALFVGLSRQMLLRHEMDVVANNIANADTAGFKLETLMAKTEPKRPANTAPGPRPVKFVLDDGVARDFGQGVLRTTGGAFDLAIEGPGFFTLSTADGERYTRDGRFTLDPSGKLITEAGEAVAGDGGGEIIVSPEKGEVSISPDGVISQAGERIGKIGVVTFGSLGALEKVGDNQFRNTSNLQPQPGTASVVRQGMLESSNVKPVVEITRMIEVTRSYERITQMLDATAELSRKSVERLGRLN